MDYDSAYILFLHT